MKLRRIKIENFRAIASWEHDFTDSLGRVRDLTLLVGPNASGKTSILDAVACLWSSLAGVTVVRPGLELSLGRIVRHGSSSARVEAEIEFSAEERQAALETLRLDYSSHDDMNRQAVLSQVQSARISWQYPGPLESPFGAIQAEPPGSAWVAQTRTRIARLLATRRLIELSWLERAGSVITFDQDRTLIGRRIPRAIWEVLANSGHLPTPAEIAGSDERYTAEVRTLLLGVAIQHALPPVNGKAGPSDFERFRDAFARVCHPHSIRGAVRDDLDRFDIEFQNGDAVYRYADLSSGEQMVLLVLLRMVSERIHRSIVLFDEIELHQHPIWQLRLLDAIRRVGVGNQIIATTHSSYLRDAVEPGAVVELADLGDRVRRADR